MMIAAVRAYSYADSFPMVAGGGRFLAVIGACIVLGSVFFSARDRWLAVGGGLGVLAAMFLGGAADRGHGSPGVWQVGSLFFAIAVEIALIPVLRRRLRPHGERTLMLGILILVGAHFVLMAPAFGPLIVLLGVLAIGNAWVGLKIPTLPLRGLWLVDGCLKVGVGALMWFGALSLPGV